MKSKKELLEELSHSMQRASTLAVLHANAVADKIGLSATEFESMDIINQYQPMTAGNLATRCGLTTGAITGIIDRLEREGLVCRVRDPKDRRRVFVKPITNDDKGHVIQEAYCPMIDALEHVASKHTPEQIKIFIDIHNEMNDTVEAIIVQMRTKRI
jgi:DNA-binding MarR family transcriptional regulator